MSSVAQTMVFIDTSIALTAGSRIGQAYAPAILEMASKGKFCAVSDALVLQEIVDWCSTSPLLDVFWGIVDVILEVKPEDWQAAKVLAVQYPGRSPRVYLHTAVMRRCGVQEMYAVRGSGFDGLPDIQLRPLTSIVR